MLRREQLFRCDFSGDSLHVFAHVRAWDAPEALLAFFAELEGDGLDEAGEVEVRAVGGGAPAARARYPDDVVPASSAAADGHVT